MLGTTTTKKTVLLILRSTVEVTVGYYMALQSSVQIGWSWTKVSVFDSQVFVQASRESFEIDQYR